MESHRPGVALCLKCSYSFVLAKRDAKSALAREWTGNY